MIVQLILAVSFAIAPLLAIRPPVATDEVPTARHERPAGMGNYGVEFIDSIHGSGLVKLNGTSVSDLEVKGSLVSKDAQLGTIVVYGEANLRDTTVKGTTFIIGSMQSQGSVFQQTITLCTPKAVFTKTRIDSLTFQKDAGFKGKQVLELKQGTTVSGSIHFESGKGEVIVDSTSRINGTVTGGKITYKSSN